MYVRKYKYWKRISFVFFSKDNKKGVKIVTQLPIITYRESIMTSIESLLDIAKGLYNDCFGKATNESIIATAAPGRVNIIGEHVDYTGGYVFPMALNGYYTICYGTGSLIGSEYGTCRIISHTLNKDDIVTLSTPSYPKVNEMKAFPHSHKHSWTNYIMGVIQQYMKDDFQNNPNLSLNLNIVIVGNVPLGSGLSSSASLEICVARFIESIMKDYAFMNFPNITEKIKKMERAKRCQKADNEFCSIPCGIMDQYVCSAAETNCALLIDCTSYDYTPVSMGKKVLITDDHDIDHAPPVFVICNSNVQHENATGEYPKRVQQCQQALKEIQNKYPTISSLRYATMDHISHMDTDTIVYKRVKHVITENDRTLKAKTAFENGNFELLGQLMNDSHTSMKDDYETSCHEIDILVHLAQTFSNAVYGSRLTGGGFGGCTVTLVSNDKVNDLILHLQQKYKEQTGLNCKCFITTPGNGVQLLSY